MRLAALTLAALLPLAAAAQDAAPLTLGDLVLSAPFARATLPNQPVGGAFLTIENTGTEDDTLLSATSPLAGHLEVHEMAMEGDVMRMRALPEGLPVPAGETVTLAPGGLHLMLMDLTGPLVEGESVEVTLTFAHAGAVTLPMPIGAPNADAAPEAGQ